MAVHRNGARLTNKVGDIELHAGDTLLLQVGPDFSRAFRNNPDFYLVSDVEDSRPVRFDRAWLAAIIFLAMITAFVSGKVDIMLAAFLAAGAMVACRCISAGDARKSVDLPVLIAIAASFGVGKALEQSGVAKLFAGLLVEVTRSWGPTATLAAIYFGTMVLNELISNNAAAAPGVPLLPGVGPAAGRQRAPVHHGRDPGRLVCLRLAHRLPDPHDGLRSRRLPLHRLRPRRRPAEPAHDDRRGDPHPDDLAVCMNQAFGSSRLRNWPEQPRAWRQKSNARSLPFPHQARRSVDARRTRQVMAPAGRARGREMFRARIPSDSGERSTRRPSRNTNQCTSSGSSRRTIYSSTPARS